MKNSRVYVSRIRHFVITGQGGWSFEYPTASTGQPAYGRLTGPTGRGLSMSAREARLVAAVMTAAADALEAE